MVEKENKDIKQNQCFVRSGRYIDNKALFYINYLCYICILLSANSVEEDYGQSILGFFPHASLFLFLVTLIS